MRQKHVQFAAVELGIATAATVSDFPSANLPKRMQELMLQADQRMERLTTGGGLDAQILESLIRQFELEKKFAEGGAPGFALADYVVVAEESPSGRKRK